MIIAIIIVVMLWYSFRNRDNYKPDNRDLWDTQKIEIRSTQDSITYESASEAKVSYFDLIDERKTVKAYQKLVQDLEAGIINNQQFQEKTYPLIKNIDIKEISLKGEERDGGDY